MRPASTSGREGLYHARIDPGWWIVRGPNGGYVAAIVLRAMAAAVGDESRAPRSLTVHYLRPPAEGDAQIATRIERAGRSLTTVTAQLLQGEKLLGLAIAAFSTSQGGDSLDETAMPEVPPPDALPAAPRRLPISARYEQRFVEGGPFGGSERARVAAWLRLSEPRRVDAPLLAAYADGLPPALMSRLRPEQGLGPLPTVDLTIHFRAELAGLALSPDDFCLAVFHSRLARHGFIEQDGEIWSRNGVLLAQSRQLAIVLGA
ncbi:MAG: thioesterase family protein [Proteobacteria bacterium]|nr:thioesterase family protein [Pseudomonadota bacterium]